MKLIVAVSLVLSLAGCASAPPPKPVSQFCFTTKDIVLENGQTVSSRVQIACSDDPTTRYLPAKVGLSPRCGWSKQYVKKGSGYVEHAFVSCQRPDGLWEVPALQ